VRVCKWGLGGVVVVVLVLGGLVWVGGAVGCGGSVVVVEGLAVVGGASACVGGVEGPFMFWAAPIVRISATGRAKRCFICSSSRLSARRPRVENISNYGVVCWLTPFRNNTGLGASFQVFSDRNIVDGIAAHLFRCFTSRPIGI
jgi:hypothetical protein